MTNVVTMSIVPKPSWQLVVAVVIIVVAIETFRFWKRSSRKDDASRK